MGRYDEALICKNGHVINESANRNPEFNTKFCDKCGAETIRKCLNCGTGIRGEYHVEGVFDLTGHSPAPSYCHDCGKPYPWIEEQLNALDEIVDLMDELSELEKQEFKQSAREVTTENPRTSLAALKIKKFGIKVGSEVYGAARDILVQIAVEAALKSSGMKP